VSKTSTIGAECFVACNTDNSAIAGSHDQGKCIRVFCCCWCLVLVAVLLVELRHFQAKSEACKLGFSDQVMTCHKFAYNVRRSLGKQQREN